MHRIGRFEVANRREWLRVAASAPFLVNVASRVLATGRPSLTAAWARAVLRVAGVRAEVVGAEHLPDAPAVLLPLHEGFFDVPLLHSLGRPMRFIARDELFEWPALGRVLHRGDHVFLPEEPSVGALRALYAHSRAVLEDGDDLVVFPQGSILGIEVAFGRGAQRIAANAGAPVVPIVITGTHRVWEHPFSPRLRFGQPVRMEVLPPVSADQIDWSDLQQAMKAIALDQDRAPARHFVPSRDGYWDGYRFEIDPAFPDLAADVRRHRSQAERGLESVWVVGADEESSAARQL